MAISTFTFTFVNAQRYLVLYNSHGSSYSHNTGWLIKNVPKFAMMLYGSTVEFKQKEMTVLKSNHN